MKKKKTPKKNPQTKRFVLPPAYFTNAIHDAYKRYDFLNWRRKPEWRLWCEAQRCAYQMAEQMMGGLSDAARDNKSNETNQPLR